MYTQKSPPFQLISTAASMADDLSAAAGIHTVRYIFHRPAILRAVYVHISTAVTVAGAVQIIKRNTLGVTSLDGTAYAAAADGGIYSTMTIPVSIGGAVIYKEVTPLLMKPGQELVFNNSTPTTGGGVAFYSIEVDEDPDVVLNLTVTASTAPGYLAG